MSSMKNDTCQGSVVIDDVKMEYVLTYKRLDPDSTEDVVGTNSMHSHEYCELFWSIDKELFFEYKRDSKFRLPAGEALLIPPGLVHRIIPSATQYYSVSLQITQVKSASSKNHLFFRMAPFLSGTGPFLFRLPDPGKKTIGELLLFTDSTDFSILFPLRLINFLLSFSTKQNQSGVVFSTDIYRISRLESLFVSKYAEPVSAKSVADELYISARHLDRISKKHFGKTFRQALTDRRVEMAEKELKTSRLSVEKIGEIVGFPSHEAFKYAFKKRFGVSPSQYQKMLEEGSASFPDLPNGNAE